MYIIHYVNKFMFASLNYYAITRLKCYDSKREAQTLDVTGVSETVQFY